MRQVRSGLRAFTLIELMLVMAIMGLLGTISIGSFRSMRRGMEESGTLRNVNRFIENARERATIDRQPTAVYFWNETRRTESDTETLLVVGHAVAVRRVGRITAKEGNYLVDEFGDLRFEAGTDSKGNPTPSPQNEVRRFIYRVNGNEQGFRRSMIGQATADKSPSVAQMMTDRTWSGINGDTKILAYGYLLNDKGNSYAISDWKVGDAYGFEFAEMTLPNNYIFGSSFSDSADDPIETLPDVLRFEPGDSSAQTINVCVIRPGKGGAPSAEPVKTKY